MDTTDDVQVRRDWLMPNELWIEIEPLLPAPKKKHPLGCHRPRVSDRSAMDAIFFVLRTGCQWNALNETGICSSSSAHRRFQEWVNAGVFELLWIQGLLQYDALVGIDWSWLSMDGAMTKAPLGGGKGGSQSHGSCEGRHQTQSPDGGGRDSYRPRRGWRQPRGLQDGVGNDLQHSYPAA